MPKFLEELQFKSLSSVIAPKDGISLYNEGGVLKLLHSSGKEQVLLTELPTGDIDLAQYATQEWTTSEIQEAINSIDYSRYALKTELPTKTSQLTNDSGFLTSHQSLTHLETKTDATNKLTEAKTYTDTKIANLVGGAPSTLDTINEIAQALQGQDSVIDALETSIGNKANKTDVYTKTESDNRYATQDYVQIEIEAALGGFDVNVDLTEYAKKTELPTKTSQLINDSGFVKATELNSYAKKSEIPTNTSHLINDSGYSTETYVNTKISDLVGSAPETLNTIYEIAAALEGQDNVIEALETTIGNKANSSDVYTKTEIDNMDFGGKAIFRDWTVTA